MTLNKESLERLWQHIIARLGQKVDKEEGKGLSSCDFTEEEKEKLKGLETNARADWNETDPTSASYIVNTPTEVENNVIVEWDGVITEDMPTIEGAYNTLYKVSNYNDTNPLKISGITAYVPGQGEVFLPADEESLDFTEQDGVSILTSSYFLIASAPLGTYIPEAGTYLMYVSERDGYIKALNGKINVVKEEYISKKIARLTDLPCGEMPGGIYWDGDTTNKESVQVGEEMFLYKISEETPDKESLIGKKIGFTSSDGYQEFSIVPNYIASFNEDLFTIVEFIIVASKETTMEGVGTFSPGTYFLKVTQGNEFAYVSYLETDDTIKMLDEKYIPDTIARKKDIGQSDWNVNDESDLSYVKNRTHYEVEKTIELLPITTVASDAPSAIADFTEDWNNDQFVALGNSRIYTTFDGKTYTYDSGLDYLETSGSSTTIMLGGNPYLFNNYLADNGLPFFVGLMPISRRFIAKWPEDDNEHTFSIKYGSGEYDVHQLDPKFISNDIARVSQLKDFATESYVDEKIETIEIPVDSVNGKTGEVVLTANDIGAMSATNPTGTGYFSMGRKEDSTIGEKSFALGVRVIASDFATHAEGTDTQAIGHTSHAEGSGTITNGAISHAEGLATITNGQNSHAEGYETEANGDGSHAEGFNTNAIGQFSHAEGQNTTTNGQYSHAEGFNTTTNGLYSHAEGNGTTATGNNSHAEGNLTTAAGENSHAEGVRTTAGETGSHAEGYLSEANGQYSHAEGYHAIVSGAASHAEGRETIASSMCQHVQGQFNVEDSEKKYAHIVGNGTRVNNRSNAHTIDWDGNAWFSSDVYVGSTSGTNKDEGSKKLATESYVDEKLALVISNDQIDALFT